MKVIYSAAHSGFDLTRVPLGGGAAVCRHLVDEWSRTRPFELDLLGPTTVWPDRSTPDLVNLSERGYAQFCRAFETAVTERILKENPTQTAVLINDVSEGPDFKRLANAGHSLFTIYHVDVVDYVARMYVRGWLRPETLTRSYAAIRRAHLDGLVPDILKLVVQKQEDSVLYSKGLIVPSTEMKNVLMRCYPSVSPSKIHVLPWGIWSDPVSPDDVKREAATLRAELQLPPNAWVLITLSRISPEKAQDRLLRALALWETLPDYPKEGIVVLMVGEAAYMHGKRFDQKLRAMAASLRKTRVIFPGFASGARKAALFQKSDLYVFPSRHESYGLSLLEAMRAGLPALACDDHGTREVMTPDVGEILPACAEKDLPRLMVDALRRLLSNRDRLRAMGQAAKAHAEAQPFEASAWRLAEIMRT